MTSHLHPPKDAPVYTGQLAETHVVLENGIEWVMTWKASAVRFGESARGIFWTLQGTSPRRRSAAFRLGKTD
jgi:hypothetical protein